MEIEATHIYLAFAALAAVIGTLWGILYRRITADGKKLDECESDRLELWKTILAIQNNTCNTPNCNLRNNETNIPGIAKKRIDELTEKIKKNAA